MIISQKAFKVRCDCLTYNHAPYIKEAFDGFCKQQTSFPYLCMIFDDCSTDGEQEIIEEYLNVHFDLLDIKESADFILKTARHKNNLNCYFAVYFLKYNHYSIKKLREPYLLESFREIEYIAFCEGDDYWTDSLKLQKQVDFLESHPDYSLCTTNSINLYSDGQKKKQNDFGSKDLNIEDIILNGGLYISSPTIVYRSHLIVNAPYSQYNLHVGDYPLQIFLAYRGKVKYLNDITSIYRVMSEGSWSSKLKNNSKDISYINDFVKKELYLLSVMDKCTDYKFTKIFNQRRILFCYSRYISNWPHKALVFFFQNPCLITRKYGLKSVIYGFLPKWSKK